MVNAVGSWETKASCADGVLEVLFGAINVRIDLSVLYQASEVMFMVSCVLRLSNFASRSDGFHAPISRDSIA